MVFILYLSKLLKGFLQRLKDDNVSAYASQSALFLIMALVPMLILILNIIRYTPVSEAFLLQTILNILPTSFHDLAGSLISDLYQNSNGTLLSVSVIFTIWSASKGIMALISGFRSINHVKETRNYFLLRFYASIYTVLFVVGLVFILTLMVFGNSLLRMIYHHFPLIYDVADWMISTRFFYLPIILTLLFLFMYRLAPNDKCTLIRFLPGALFSATGWLVFSSLYSWYIDHFVSRSYSYGSLGILVFLMLWLYIGMYIIFIGAEINNYFYIHFRFIKRRVKKKIGA